MKKSGKPGNMNQEEPTKTTKKKSGVKSEKHKALFEQERLQRENQMSKKNIQSLRHSWMHKMTKIEIPTMQEETKISRNIFNRTLDIKQSKINSILVALDETEKQYKRNIEGHLEAISRLEAIYDRRLSDIWNNFTMKQMGIIEQSQTDRNKVLSMNNQSDTHLQAVTMRENRNVRDLLEKIQSETSYKLNNLQKDKGYSMKIILADIENRINFYHDYLDSIIAEYANKTCRERDAYHSLKVKDRKDFQIITNHLIEIAELFDAIQKYRERIKKLKSSIDDATINIGIEKKLFAKAYSGIRQRFHNEQLIDKSLLTHMTKEFNLSIQQLRRFVKKTQTVISFIRICRKFETHGPDKPLPVEPDGVTNDYPNDFQVFWHQVGLLQIETILLKKQRDELFEKNSDLEQCVRYRIASQLPKNYHVQFNEEEDKKNH